MTLTYEPGDSPAHGLDARAKLAVQFAFVAAAFAHTTPVGLAALTVVAGGCLLGAALSPLRALSEYRVLLPFLVLAPLLQGATLGPPWFVPADAVFPALAGYRVLLVLLVAAAYVRTTPPRESRAAVQRVVPGRAGRLLGLSVGLVFRFLPVLQADLARGRAAMRARLGSERALHDRMRLVALGGLRRAFARADTLALAMRARCLAWNPTLPHLAFTRRDAPALALAAILLAWAILPVVPAGVVPG